MKNVEGRHKLNPLHALMASAVILAVFVLLSIVCEITPFGDKTFLMGDLKRQYVDYYAYLKTIMSGDNDAAYSFSTTLGSGMIGFFAYYLSSPFLVILSLFPQNLLPVGISVVICLKLMTAAFIMDLYLQRTVGGRGMMLCSIAWAFSAYLFAHSMNMMWIDVVIMLPLAIWSLEHILESDRKVPYIIVICLMLIFNYYITYQVLIFIALWTVMRIFVRDYDNKPMQFMRVAFATVTAVCIDAVLMVPTALELLNSPKDIAQLGLKLTGKNLSLLDLLSKVITCAYDYLEARSGYPQIFCGVLLIFLLALYFADGNVPLRERIGMLSLFAILTVSFCLDFLNLLWHAGMEPSGHPYRQAFLWIFMVIYCSAKALSNLDKNLKYYWVIGITAGISIMLILIAVRHYDHAPLKVIGVNFVFTVFYFIMMMLLVYGRKKDIKKLQVIIMALLLLFNTADLSLNARETYLYQSLNAETESFFSETIRNNLQAVNFVKEKDTSFYRMENLNPRQQNDALQYNYNGVTHYSSAGMIYVRYLLQRLGFNDSGLFTSYGHDNTALSDMLLGIKYVLSDGTYSVHSDYEMIYDGKVSAYENPRAMAIAVEVPGFNLSGISDDIENEPDSELSHVPSLNAFSLQEEIASRLLGKELSAFKPATLKSGELLKDDAGKYYIDHEVTAAIDGEIYMYLDGLIGAKEGLTIYVDGELLTTYGNASCVKILNLGYRKANDTFTVRVQAENKTDNMGKAIFVTEDLSALNEAYESIRNRNCRITRKTSSRLVIEAGNCEGIFTTIPFEEGWKIKVDGQITEPIAVYDAFTYIPVDSARYSHVIEMTFVSPGVHAGIAGTVVGLILLALMILSEQCKKKQKLTTS